MNVFLDRVEKVKKELTELNVEALYLENLVDIAYLTGLHFSAGKVIIAREEEPVLLVDPRYIELAQKNSPLPVLLDNDENFKIALSGLKTCEFDGHTLSWDRVNTLKKDFTDVEWTSYSMPLKRIRAVKETQEQILLREAAELGSKGYDYILTLLKTGVTEKELAAKLETFWKSQGGEGFAFDPIIAFGQNSAIPHWRASSTALKPGDTVLIDIGVIYKGVNSDMTRTVYYGEPSSQLKEIYQVVQEAQKLAINQIKEGTRVKEADSFARDYIDSRGYGDKFSHSLGHGIGLEVHEWPILRNKGPAAEEILFENMCVTIEPGIYLPGIGGVRIEDTVLITKEGCETFTHRPTDLKVITPNA